MLGPQNAQEFIRALKASSDPPHVGGPSKIDIAKDAWENTHLYVPNKAEAIIEWLLTRLLKDRSRDRQSNPLCDIRYWDLLAKILTSEKHGDHGRTSRAWLVPLLNRVPIAPVILSYLELVASEGSLDIAQYAAVSQCITALWPLAVPKFNPDTLLECFGAAVHLVVAHGGRQPPDCESQLLNESRALSLIVQSYRASLVNAGSKRKQLYTLFLQKHLKSWLEVATRSWGGQNVRSSLEADMYDAGIETVFVLEVLKPAADQKHDSALVEALERTMQASYEIVLRPLPRLFASYVQTVKRHKSALFGQGSSQVPGQIAYQVQAAAMAFYSNLSTLTRAGGDDDFWRCRVSLLDVVEKENLFNPKDDEARILLRQDGDIAVETLNNAHDEAHTFRTDSAVQVLALLTRIDYDLMSTSAAVLFPRLVAIPSAISSTLQYLKLLLEYDSKTRNLPASIMHVSDAFSVPHLQRIPGGPRAAYEAASAGPLTSLTFLDELSRAVHSFLTPGQVLETIGDISRTLKDAHAHFLDREAKLSADRGDGPRKKRRKDTSLSEDRTEPEYHAVSFALIARTMVVVLRSLPLHTLTDDVRLEAEKAIMDVHSAVACRILRDGFLQADRRDSWHWQMVIAGSLRLHLGLACTPGLLQQSHLEQPILSALLASIAAPSVLQELVVEMFRTLLHQCSVDALPPHDVLGALLSYLENHPPSASTTWSGKAHVLSTGAEAAVALLHVLADRWLPYFDVWSTKEQRERLAQILTSIRLSEDAPKPGSTLTISSIFTRMLHDAQFWELLNTRDAFVAQLNQQTASLDEFEVPKLLARKGARRLPDDILRYVSAYDVLLRVPPEYLPRAMHIEFLKRGFVADILVYTACKEGKQTTASTQHLLVIREFLRRTIAFLGSVENVVTKEFLEYLIAHAPVADHASLSSTDGYVSSVTMELIDMYQGTLVRSAKRGSIGVLADLVNRYISLDGAKGSVIARRASLLLIDTLVREGTVTDFPEELVSLLRAMYKRLLALSASSVAQPGLSLDVDVLDTWSHVQSLRRWLQEEDQDMPAVGRPLVQRLLSWRGNKQEVGALAPVVLAVMLGEMQAVTPARRREELEYIVVAYLAFTRFCGRQDMKQLDSKLGVACRSLSADDFAGVLDLISDGLSLQGGLSTKDVASLIRLSTTVLHDAPEGTSRVCQAFATKSLNMFADDERFVADLELRSEVIEFLVRQCNDRPASLRPADLSSLWSLLRSLLANSPVHEPSTDATVFHGVVNVLSALVRLRRDLVLNTLPHLGFILRQLVSCLRSLRPQLGGKQSRIVLDTLPRWIAPSQPLSAQESKALARLLTTLTTKTMIRTHSAAAETQKPESLVRPFSKHAAYVLTAYVEAVNDPLCFVSSAIRKELQPGLFALCDMLGEHNRDAMMVSALDAGGKVTMKALWKEYEKQRYVGKG
ncbi:Urb2/Npa2 family-domain-containing protein [Cubamyces lactineus]|nr:Urb2/Npa2 family-domain-containing protein [Cubamyces lactineus]